MRLSQLPLFAGQNQPEIEFANLGFLSSKAEGLLAYCVSPAYAEAANRAPNLAGVLAPPNLADLFRPGLPVAAVPDPVLSYYQLHNYLIEHTDFYRRALGRSIAASACIHPSAVIAEGEVIIGERVEIGPHVTIAEQVIIEDDAVIEPGAVIGLDGIQFVRRPEGLLNVKHAGGVRIGRGARIGAGDCVARGLFRGDTTIGEECLLGANVNISHGCLIGRRCFISGLVTISGSVEVGDDVWISSGSTITNNISIGREAFIGLGALVKKSVADRQTVVGQASPTVEELSARRRGKSLAPTGAMRRRSGDDF